MRRGQRPAHINPCPPVTPGGTITSIIGRAFYSSERSSRPCAHDPFFSPSPAKFVKTLVRLERFSSIVFRATKKKPEKRRVVLFRPEIHALRPNERIAGNSRFSYTLRNVKSLARVVLVRRTVRTNTSVVRPPGDSGTFVLYAPRRAHVSDYEKLKSFF